MNAKRGDPTKAAPQIPVPQRDHCNTTSPHLRDYQEEALQAIAKAIVAGIFRLLLVLPTGTGKTIVFAELIRRRGGRAIVLVHRDELVTQAVDKLRAACPRAHIGVVKAARNDTSADIIVASIQTLARANRLSQLRGPFATVVVDEAHHSVATSYRKILDYLVSDTTLLLGVTATPDRADGAGLGAIYECLVYQKSLPEMISKDYLSDLRAIQISTEADYGSMRVKAGDYVAADAGNALMKAHVPDLVARAFLDHVKDRRTLIFTPTVEVAYAMTDALRSQGVAAEGLDGTTPDKERKTLLARFSSGETQVIANCAVLTEGYDEPRVDCVVIARPTRSRAAYLQMIGRGTRRHPEKGDCLILDIMGAASRLDLVTMAGLAGVDVEALARRPLTEALREHRAELPPAGTWAAEIVAEEIDLFRKRPMAWVTSGRNFILGIGDGHIVLAPDHRAWTVSVYRRDGERELVAEGLSLEWAQGVGEDLARQLGAAVLTDRGAPWRQRPATEKQLDTLRRMRIKSWHGITGGQASDLISAKTVARRAS